MKKTYLKGYDEYRKAIKEGLNIYEFEDDVQEPVADLDSETEKAEEAPEVPSADAPSEEPESEPVEPSEEPVVEEPNQEPNQDTPPLDFGDNGTNLSVDELNSKLDFIDGVIEEYKKLIKNGDTVDPKIQARIQSTFDSIS